MKRLVLLCLTGICCCVWVLAAGMEVAGQSSETFNMTIHDCALQYSAASHCSDASLYAWNCSHCTPLPGFQVTEIAYDSVDNIRGFVGLALQNRTVVAAFRGTVGDLNWLEDGDFYQIQLPGAPPGVKVHQGFDDTWRTIAGRVRKAVQLAAAQLRARGVAAPNLLVTGHSLGGALAALCTVDLHQRNITGQFANVWMYNYGQPRVGNPAFADYYQSLQPVSFRVINKRDPVPHLPPQHILGDSYEHAPTEVWYHGLPPRYEICQGGEDPNCSDGVLDIDPLDHATYMGVEMDC